MTDSTRKAFATLHDAVGVGTPVTVTGLTVLHVSLQDWVYIITIIVSLAQIGRYAYLGWAWWQKRRAP